MFENENTLNKSVNQLWKESGSTLTFADWIKREQLKGVIPEKEKSNVANDTLQTIQKIIDPNASQSPESNGKKLEIFGLNPWIVVGAVVLISGAYIYSKTKKA